MHAANGNGHSSDVAPKPALQPSILGVEPLDEFIREVADFIHYHITNRPPDTGGAVEVEAKIGVLKDRTSGQRLQLPVLVETGAHALPTLSQGTSTDPQDLGSSYSRLLANTLGS